MMGQVGTADPRGATEVISDRLSRGSRRTDVMALLPAERAHDDLVLDQCCRAASLVSGGLTMIFETRWSRVISQIVIV
jgi:hypothetical protein